MRVRPEQVSKLLRYIVDVGAASERESLLYGSVPDSETRSLLYCWRRYNFREAQFIPLFSSVQPQKHGVVLLTSTAADKQLYCLHMYSLRNRWLY